LPRRIYKIFVILIAPSSNAAGAAEAARKKSSKKCWDAAAPHPSICFSAEIEIKAS
jgi:hypothetical protein